MPQSSEVKEDAIVICHILSPREQNTAAARVKAVWMELPEKRSTWGLTLLRCMHKWRATWASEQGKTSQAAASSRFNALALVKSGTVSPSVNSGLGHRPFTAVTGVRVPRDANFGVDLRE